MKLTFYLRQTENKQANKERKQFHSDQHYGENKG